MTKETALKLLQKVRDSKNEDEHTKYINLIFLYIECQNYFDYKDLQRFLYSIQETKMIRTPKAQVVDHFREELKQSNGREKKLKKVYEKD